MSNNTNLAKLARVIGTGTNAQVLTSQGGSAFSFADATGGGGASVTSYAAPANFPSSGNTVGDFAFATNAPKALYVWDGAEWDRIWSGGQEGGPTFSTSPSSSYTLSGGANTDVTVAATDPDGFPITYSVVTNPTSQAQATITQPSAGLFRFAATSNSSNAGSFTAKFIADDGVQLTTSSSTLTLAFGISHSAQYIVIAGGGSGGTSSDYMAGGGGAGGLLYGTATLAPGTTWTVTIGAGGAVVAGGTSASYNQGLNGANSTISGSGVSATAIGGGGGAAGAPTVTNGSAGGSGGGGSRGAGLGGAATSGQGNIGGVGNDTSANGWSGGGGGGASAVGASGATTAKGGSGSNTYSVWHTATSTGVGGYVAAGGSGARYTSGTNASINGGGGANNSSATANTGSGGGGGGSLAGTASSGAGGSGLIIIRYTTPTDANDVATGGTITTSGGYTYHTFLSSGTLTN